MTPSWAGQGPSWPHPAAAVAMSGLGNGYRDTVSYGTPLGAADAITVKPRKFQANELKSAGVAVLGTTAAVTGWMLMSARRDEFAHTPGDWTELSLVLGAMYAAPFVTYFLSRAFLFPGDDPIKVTF